MRLIILLGLGIVLALAVAVMFGETPLSAAQYAQAFSDPAGTPAQVLFAIRLPRALAAGLTGAALGMAGAAMQGLLRNPLADPGVLGVSAFAGVGAAGAISLGLAAIPGAIELGALGGALVAGAIVTGLAARFREPESLILIGVALSAFGGAVTSLVFNLSPSPIFVTEVMSWLMGSAANRDWPDLAKASLPMALGASLILYSGRGLRMLSLGEEGAALSGLPMARLRAAAVAGAALLTGAAVAMAGVIGFVGLTAPHMVRAAAKEDPGELLWPSALAGALLLILADLAARLIPTDEELKLGVVTALFGAPAFALIAWRAARSWRR